MILEIDDYIVVTRAYSTFDRITMSGKTKTERVAVPQNPYNGFIFKIGSIDGDIVAVEVAYDCFGQGLGKRIYLNTKDIEVSTLSKQFVKYIMENNQRKPSTEKAVPKPPKSLEDIINTVKKAKQQKRQE